VHFPSFPTMKVGTTMLVALFIPILYNLILIILHKDQVNVFFVVGAICRICPYVGGNDLFPQAIGKPN
jgi:hypothetical protein